MGWCVAGWCVAGWRVAGVGGYREQTQAKTQRTESCRAPSATLVFGAVQQQLLVWDVLYPMQRGLHQTQSVLSTPVHGCGPCVR